MADRRPLSIQESTYFVGSNSFRGGPTSLTKSREEMATMPGMASRSDSFAKIPFHIHWRKLELWKERVAVASICQSTFSRPNITMGISEQSTLLCEQKLLTSRQIFRYAVPSQKKHWSIQCVSSGRFCSVLQGLVANLETSRTKNQNRKLGDQGKIIE